ncbi:MAG: CBS domain-containing protein [Bacteroidetes bacterium]|nr:CBS domain-containing protein [Bacteroidota bacterium]
MANLKTLIDHKSRSLISVSNNAKIIDALKIMAELNIGCLAVLNGEEFVGIFTERDYARKIILVGKSSDTTLVYEIMGTDLPILNLTDSIEECSRIMTEKNLRYLPVFENNKLVNVISQSDIVKHTIEAQKSLIAQLNEYINSR